MASCWSAICSCSKPRLATYGICVRGCRAGPCYGRRSDIDGRSCAVRDPRMESGRPARLHGAPGARPAEGWPGRPGAADRDGHAPRDRLLILRERPADIAFDVLPCGSDDSWGERWEALIRYLEERAPCTYVMVHDWRNNVVAARLSDRVRLIGIVQADRELEFEQAVRLGLYWDAIVAKSDVIHFGLAQRAPQLYPRLADDPQRGAARHGRGRRGPARRPSGSRTAERCAPTRSACTT